MAAARQNLTVEQGAYWSQELLWKDADDIPVDISGYSARMQLRTSFRSSTAVIELTDGDGITLGDDEGTILLEMTAEQTEGIRAGRYLYDLEMVPPDGKVVRLMQGKIKIAAEVTK